MLFTRLSLDVFLLRIFSDKLLSCRLSCWSIRPFGRVPLNDLCAFAHPEIESVLFQFPSQRFYGYNQFNYHIIVLSFCFQYRSHYVRIAYIRVDCSCLSRMTLQRYDEQIVFCKFFQRKNSKNAFFYFSRKNPPQKLHKLQNCTTVYLPKILIIII